jgi:uncharacterized protein YhhL (DUF1145 family)
LIFRYVFLIVWSVLVLSFIKPNLATYCVSLLAAQFAIVIHHLYTAFKNSKLYKNYVISRGEDEKRD